MAGQPTEPAWQPGGQDQARAAWPQPTYTPSADPAQDSYPPPASAPQDSYAYAQQAPEDSYAYQQQQQSAQDYPAPPYTLRDQTFPGMTSAGQPKRRTDKGFLGSLFDFTFTSFVTPKIIKVLYILFSIWTAIWAVIILRFGFHYGVAAGIFILVVVEPIFILLTLGVCRVILEAFMVAFRMYEELKRIREQGGIRS